MGPVHHCVLGIRTVTVRERRVLVIGSVIVGAAIGGRILPVAVRSMVRAEQEMDQRAVLLAHTRSDLAQTDALSESAAILTHNLTQVAPKVLNGATSADAQADLADRLDFVAARHQVRLMRVDPLPDSGAAGRLRRVAARMELESDVRGLAAVLQTLATGPLALGVEQLRVVAPDARSVGPGPEVLKTELTVTGWYLAKADAASGMDQRHP